MQLAKRYYLDGKCLAEDEIREMVSSINRIGSHRVKTTLKFIEGERLLDIGCGIGTLTATAARRCKYALGIDFFPEPLEIARDFVAREGLEFKQADFLQADFPGDSFDCVLFLETIEHVENPTGYLKEIKRVLKPGGVAIISTPNAQAYNRILKHSLLKFSRLVENIKGEKGNDGTHHDHICLWDFETLARLLVRSGLTPEEYAFAGGSVVHLSIGGLKMQIPPFTANNDIWWGTFLGRFGQNIIIKARKLSG